MLAGPEPASILTSFSRVLHSIVVVPCFNEARRLNARAFTEFRATGRWVEFLFVSDGSTDETLEVLKRMQCASPDTIRVHDQKQNRGKGEAVRVGLLAALDAFFDEEHHFAQAVAADAGLHVRGQVMDVDRDRAIVVRDPQGTVLGDEVGAGGHRFAPGTQLEIAVPIRISPAK